MKLIKIFSLLILAAWINQTCIVVANQESCDWLRPLLTEKHADKWIVIEESDYYEVVVSKEASAMNSGLIENQFVSIDEVDAKGFTGFYYRSSKQKKPYLVRSVYGYGGTGNYIVLRRGNDLLIEHNSLGGGVNYHKSALIINLDFKPEKIFITCSIGK